MSTRRVIRLSPEALQRHVKEAVAACKAILVAEFQAERNAYYAQFMAETEALIEARLAQNRAETEAMLVQLKAET